MSVYSVLHTQLSWCQEILHVQSPSGVESSRLVVLPASSCRLRLAVFAAAAVYRQAHPHLEAIVSYFLQKYAYLDTYLVCFAAIRPLLYPAIPSFLIYMISNPILIP
jgi:hypothetical protein